MMENNKIFTIRSSQCRLAVRYISIILFASTFAAPYQAFSQNMPWQQGNQQQSSSSQTPGLHSVNGVPLFIDGTQSKNHPAALSSDALDKVRNVTTLRDALPILGPAYAGSDDANIAHWHFQDGTMLTLWPQGNESLDDTVSIYPRPDCGVPANQCKDLVLGRKSAQKKQHSHNGGGGNGGSSGSNSSGMPSAQSLMPLMKLIPGGR